MATDLGQLIAAVAARLGIEDSERAALVMRMCVRETIRANELRELWFNKKETTVTPLVVGQFIYPQGPSSADLPQDWLAPLAFPDERGDPTAWISTVADPDVLFPFTFLSPGEYRECRARTRDQKRRPEYWTMIDEALYLVPAPDVTTYIVTLNYIFDASENFDYTITDGAWAGSGDSYNDRWFDEDGGFHFLADDVAKRMRMTYLKDIQNAQGPASGAAEHLYKMTSRSAQNTVPDRIASRW